MRKFTLLLAMLGLVCVSFGQTKSQPATKGDGSVFWTHTFGWGNPADPKGWTAPEGFFMEDPADIGFNWHWWPGTDSLVANWTSEPPFKSTTAADGFLCLFLDKYNKDNGNSEINLVDNAVVFPVLDFSAHTSVVISYETHFMAYSITDMYLDITTDNWVHAATYNVDFGCGHKDRPNDAAPGMPTIFEANITDVAAGAPVVQWRIRWTNTRLYFWNIDDFKLAEAYNNDLRIRHFTVEWENNDPNQMMSGFFMIPKSQLKPDIGFMNFRASALNFGEFDQEDVYMDLSITKNNQIIWQKQTDPLFVLPLLNTDTAWVYDKFIPTDFGHYKVKYDFKQSQAEQSPENDQAEFFFHVTDSVYSRSDDTPDLAWSYGFERYTTALFANEDYFTGSIFPIYADCEVNSVSTYMMGGPTDGLIEFQFQLWLKPIGEEDETAFKLLTSEIFTLGPEHKDKWITLPFEKDGESEFLFAGDLVYAGISYWDWHEDYLFRRKSGMRIGTDRTVKMVASTAVGIYDGNEESGLGNFVGRRNLMCRLNINDHSNIIDAVDVTGALSTLGQNYPNPFKQSTEISYELANGADVTIEVMDLTGRKVMEINEGQRAAGKHTAVLNAAGLEAGVYFYTLKAGNFTETKRMMISE